jgi:hypothetical protein
METDRTATRRTNDPAANPDLITKAPGSHPVGTGIGAAAGGAAGIGGAIAVGAMAGSVVGPIGTAAGAVVGAVAGGLIGSGVAEGVNPSVEHEYWRSNYASRPYVNPGTSYDQFGPAYQYGWESREKYEGKNFDDVEPSLNQDWSRAKGTSQLKWDKAKFAARDAWDRIGSDEETED